jgi:FSR family fosmidomycin resistance protein-like MFS transporter
MSNFRRNILFLASGHFMIHVYSQIIPAVLPTIKTELNISLVEASYLISIPLLVNVLAYIPAGIISDRYGQKIMSVCFITSGLGAAILALSDSFPLLLIGSALLGLGSTLFHPPSLKATTLVDPQRMNLAMSFHLAGGTTGNALGPISLGLLMPLFGWRKALLIWVPFEAILAYASLTFTTIDGNHPPAKEKPIHQGFRTILTPTFLLVIATGGFIELTVVNLSGFITTYFNSGLGISESISSILFGLGSLAGIIGVFTGARLGDKYGNLKALLMILSVITLLLGFMFYIDVVFVAASVYVIYRSLVSATMPLMNSIVALNSNIEHRSLAFSIYFMVSNLGASIMPMITSYLAERNGISVLFPLSVILLLPSLVLLYYLNMRSRRNQD